MEELFTNTASKLSQLPLRIRAVQESPLGETQSEKEANTLLEEVHLIVISIHCKHCNGG